MLLDEATSALDNYSEKKVNSVLNNFQKKVTTIIVAHRLSTIVEARRIIFFFKGSIEAEGSHKKLLKENSLYRNHFLSIKNK